MPETPEPIPDEALVDVVLDGFLPADESDPLETDHMPAGRSLRFSARRRMMRIRRRRRLAELLPAPPEPGESIHIVGDGGHDFWTYVPQLIDWFGRVEELYCSTWTLSRPNAMELLELMDAGRVGRVSMLTGLYFKRRESAVYATLLHGLRKRAGRYVAFRNHAKVLLLSCEQRDAWICVEGSANLTGNPRLEQYVITNSRTLYDFHRKWMEECLNR